MSLEALRQQIDSIDRQLIILLRRRIQVSKKIMVLKKNLKMSIIDQRREAEIMSNFIKGLGSQVKKKKSNQIVKSILELNPKYVERKLCKK